MKAQSQLQALYRHFSTTSQVTKSVTKVLHYNLQTKDYTLFDLDNGQTLPDFLSKHVPMTTGRLYLLRNFPSPTLDNSLLAYRNTTQETQTSGHAETSTFGSDTYANLVSLRSELGVDAIVGVVNSQGSLLSPGSPEVKEAKDFMRAQEPRDSLTVVFVNGNDQLQQVLGPNITLSTDFAEALVDLKAPSNSSEKSQTPPNAKNMGLVALNFLLLMGVSIFNIWLTKVMVTPKESTDQNQKEMRQGRQMA
ncbi:hypothetical protein FGO68_gene13014 [Halteria grandinella]|uniref:Uncharacterized protein n=1 Tax=Halteria grandinella TaxID=5974 RepID=A0A8J8NX22_HALGN|nr:hypothetical protein FGO68_gene13014 [Halteria grandinella]